MDDERFSSRLLLYGIVDGTDCTDAVRARVDGLTGLDGQPVRLREVQDLGVLVSPVAPDAAPRRPDARVLHAYRSVADAVFAACPVLPLRYGTRVGAETELDALVRSAADAYRSRLAHLRGHAQMDVRLTLPEGDVQPVLEMSGPAYRADRPGTAYLLARQRKADQDAARRRHAARPYRDALDALAVETQVDRALDDDRLLTLAYLVRRDAVDAVRRAAERVRTPGVRDVDVVGPIAPHAFA